HQLVRAGGDELDIRSDLVHERDVAGGGGGELVVGEVRVSSVVPAGSTQSRLVGVEHLGSDDMGVGVDHLCARFRHSSSPRRKFIEYAAAAFFSRRRSRVPMDGSLSYDRNTKVPDLFCRSSSSGVKLTAGYHVIASAIRDMGVTT